MQLFLAGSRATSRDDSNEIAMASAIYDDQQSCVWIASDRSANYAVNTRYIKKAHEQRIHEDRHCFMETNAMFGVIARSFVIVPNEVVAAHVVTFVHVDDSGSGYLPCWHCSLRWLRQPTFCTVKLPSSGGIGRT